MNCSRCLLFAATLVALSSPALAQRSGEKSKTDELTAAQIHEARQKRLMPKPLDAIESNLRDLEQEGFFSIVGGNYKIINNGQDNALVWTVKANRTLTCRHIVRQLELMSDVRLFKTLGADSNNPSLHEVHSLRLYYSARLDDGASNSRLFARDDLFEIWVYLDAVEVRKIRSLLADLAIFRAPKRR